MKTNEFNELEQLREQNVLLKEMLSRQKIVDEKRVSSIINRQSKKLNREVTATLVMSIIATPYVCWTMLSILHTSVAFSIFTGVYMVYCVVLSFIRKRRFDAIRTIDDNLLDYFTRIQKLHKKEHKWWDPNYIILVVWLVWFCYEMYSVNIGASREFMLGLYIGCAVGGCIGLAFGIWHRIKVQRGIDEILASAEELRELKGE